MARRFGVRTPDVILLPIGGVARLERIPDEPRQELLIALAGPAVTLAIIVVLYLVLRLSGESASMRRSSTRDAPFLAQLMAVNIYLLLFNLIPAFPMDGGRVLRALLASRLGWCGEPGSRRGWARCSRGRRTYGFTRPDAVSDPGRLLRVSRRQRRGHRGGDRVAGAGTQRGADDGHGFPHHPGPRDAESGGASCC